MLGLIAAVLALPVPGKPVAIGAGTPAGLVWPDPQLLSCLLTGGITKNLVGADPCAVSALAFPSWMLASW